MKSVKKAVLAPAQPNKPLDADAIEPGGPIPSLVVPALTQVALARFAGASDDYNPMHLDDRAAVAAGKPSVFAPANLLMAYVGRMVEAWLQGGSLRRLGLRMIKLVWPGDVVTCRGLIVDKRIVDGVCTVDADVWADNQRGETVAKGRVLVVLAEHGPLSAVEAQLGVVYTLPERFAVGA